MSFVRAQAIGKSQKRQDRLEISRVSCDEAIPLLALVYAVDIGPKTVAVCATPSNLLLYMLAARRRNTPGTRPSLLGRDYTVDRSGTTGPVAQEYFGAAADSLGSHWRTLASVLRFGSGFACLSADEHPRHQIPQNCRF